MYKHIPSEGYLTGAIRIDYINMYIKKNLSIKSFTDTDIISLYANTPVSRHTARVVTSHIRLGWRSGW